MAVDILQAAGKIDSEICNATQERIASALSLSKSALLNSANNDIGFPQRETESRRAIEKDREARVLRAALVEVGHAACNQVGACVVTPAPETVEV